MRDGIVLINKPAGFTSFDVIAKLRGILKTKRLGHAGTLDPMAVGVLPVFVGRATLACDLLPNHDKKYIASFRLGITTATQDSTGEITNECESHVTKAQVENALERFSGEIEQTPPMYSAIKVQGKRLYDLAREGIEVEVKSRKIVIYEIKLLEFDEKTQSGKIQVFCSKGTYIRTICHDLGKVLGVGGIMTDLCRTNAAGFELKECLSLDEIQSLCDKGEIDNVIIPIERVFESYPKITLTEKQTSLFLNGVKLSLPFEEGILRVYSFDNVFLGLGFFENDLLKIKKLFLTKEGYEQK